MQAAARALAFFSRERAPDLPHWAQVTIVPVINVLVALALAGVVVGLLGENPFSAILIMIKGALVYPGGFGYTFFYATNLIFTGLCVALAFQALQFNIGGEGQAMMGGLGCGLLLLALGDTLPLLLLFPLAVLAAAGLGGLWGFIPGYLYAKRGSHIVITTIMFNFIAAAILQYLLVNVLIEPGQMSPQSEEFAEGAHLPYIHEMMAAIGIKVARTPLNISIFLALLSALFVWVLIWRTPWGYAVRTVGKSPTAAIYGGINPDRLVVQLMFVSGAMAGLLGINAVMGDSHRLLIGFSTGYGFAGIGVALMGRNHPVGIVLAASLFGILIQGGSELDFEFEVITREIVVVVQGLIILMTGALAQMFDPAVARVLQRISASRKAGAAEAANG